MMYLYEPISFLRSSMEFYRGKEFQPQETELQAIIDKEANEASSNTKSKSYNLLTILKSQDFLRPFKCVGVLYILLDLSGFYIIQSFTASYFEGW